MPLKSPGDAKSRLAPVLDEGARRRLYFALAEHVIGVLRETPGIAAIAVVTASAEVARFARELGAEPVMQPADRGTAQAFAAAVRHLQALRVPRLLMIAGDLPLATRAAVRQLLDAAPPRGMVIVPDRRRIGTNALLCAPPDAVDPCFGEDSFRRHLAAAAAAGVAAHVVEPAELTLDLDLPEDLEQLRATAGALAAGWFSGALAGGLDRSAARLVTVTP